MDAYQTSLFGPEISLLPKIISLLIFVGKIAWKPLRHRGFSY
jgi:hypothetical protein